MKIDTPDVMASLLASHENRQPSEKEMQDLIADSQLVIVAGRFVKAFKPLLVKL